MKILLLAISMLFLSACSPKYKVVKEYHAPKVSQNADTSVCLGNCETQRNACKSKCDAALSSCKMKAHRVALERYEAKMQRYTQKLESYVNQMDMNQIRMSFFYARPYGSPFYGRGYGYHPYGGFANSLFWYDPMPFYGYGTYGPKPRKPSLAKEQRLAEAEFCDGDCACTQKFDNCYIGCGGEVLSKKVCIENCP